MSPQRAPAIRSVKDENDEANGDDRDVKVTENVAQYKKDDRLAPENVKMKEILSNQKRGYRFASGGTTITIVSR